MWEINYTERFLKELAALPESVQSRVEVIVFEELKSNNHFALGYISKMKG